MKECDTLLLIHLFIYCYPYIIIIPKLLLLLSKGCKKKKIGSLDTELCLGGDNSALLQSFEFEISLNNYTVISATQTTCRSTSVQY